MPDALLNSTAAASLAAASWDPIRADRCLRWRVSALATVLLAAVVLTTGCSLFPKKQVRYYQPPPPVPRPAPPPLKPIDVDAPQLEADLNPDLTIPAPVIALTPPPPPPPVIRPRPPVAAIPKPPAAPVAPDPPAPKIALILPPEQLRAFNTELDAILERDQRDLDLLSRRSLAAEQRDRVAQIRELLAQARQTREQDLVSAVNLARHADTLAKDLLDRAP